jgi:TolB-like protein
VTLVLAWYHGERGAQRATGTELLILALLLTIGGAVVWRLAPTAAEQPASTAQAAPTKPAAVASVPIDHKSIAVLAFDDLSSAHDQANFSEGMAEEILNALTRVKALTVIARSSSFQFQGKGLSPEQIGAQLGVAHVLSGSVRKQGEQLRITVALVQTSDGVQQWSNSYDGVLADIFKLQESCARDIATQMNVVLGDNGKQRLVDKSTDNADAYALLVEAQTLVNARVGDRLPRAIALLQQATAIDPNFARAWSKLAVAYAVLAQYVGGDWQANWKASDAAAQRALALDPNDAEAYTALSYNQFSQRHYIAMVEPMQRALQSDPDNAAANYWAANESSAMGRTTATETRLDAMLRNDPANALVLFYKGAMRARAGDTAGMLEMMRRLGKDDSPFAQFLLFFHSANIGDHEHGAQQYAKGMHGFGAAMTPAELAAVYRGIYQGEALRQAALKIVATHSGDDWAPTLLLQLGEPARSFAAFEQGKSGLSDAYLNFLWHPEAWSRKARQDPSFQGFAKRMGMVDYWKQYGWPDLCKPAPAAGPDAFACR